MNDLYQIAFRITKGRNQKFELHHRDRLLLPSAERASPYLSRTHDILITQLGTETATSSTSHEELCLVKVYSGYDEPVISYWQPRATTKSLGSAIFRFYRQKFLEYSSTKIQEPFLIRTDLENIGDNSIRGHSRNSWEPMANYFNLQHSTGRLAPEPVWDKKDDEETIETRHGKVFPY